MNSDINHLLERYFEGLSSASEEKEIRRYFSQPNPDEELKEYQPLFRFFENESEAQVLLKEILRESKTTHPRRYSFRRYRLIASVAASLLVALIWLSPEKQSSRIENHIWVDGKRITDPNTVKKHVELSFERVQPEGDIIEDQIRFVLE